MSDIHKQVKNYYNPYNRLKIVDIDSKIITAKTELEREQLLKKYTPLINKLKDRFKKLVLARNKLAQKYGFDNYFDFISDWDKVPKNKLNDFLRDGEVAAKKIFDSLPKRFKDSDWLTGNYNNFNFDGFIANKDIDIPNDIFNFLNKKLKVKKEILDSIKLEETKDNIFTANADFTKRKVIIKYSDSDPDANLATAMGLAHEFGHAIEQVNLMQKGVNPEDRSFYYHETYAINLEMKFAESISNDARKARIGNFLYTFANAFFEYEVYKKPDCDFEVVYAQSRNKVCPQLKQIRNPFYVFNTFLIEYPCYSTIYSVIYNEYLKNKF